MNTHELREAFLRFFEERDHRRVPGAPIVPPGDPTLLFTSAGMVQFKPYFMGQSKPPHPRLATVQKCFRTTDIEEVGDTSHLTFFEMLGNFSVGDYFKMEIIPWAWEFYTEVLKLTPDRLWPAVYLDDDESYDAWVKIGVPPERIKHYGDEYNYWFSGEVGPCGPDSEIYYDFGEQFGCGPTCEPAHDCGRFLEIWNLVFMSFYCDGEQRTPLPARNVDTGAGLERNACVLLFESEGWDQSNLPSVYDTDLFLPIIRRVEDLSGKRYGNDEKTDRAIRIVAEHARAVTFLIGDERTPVVPSNEERGYVVRRMLRRAVYFGRQYLGIRPNFLADVCDEVIDSMSGAYPELLHREDSIGRIVYDEEERFRKTLETGRVILADELLPTRQRFLVSLEQPKNELAPLFLDPSPSIVDRVPDVLNLYLGQMRKDSPIHPVNLHVIQAAQQSVREPIVSLLDRIKDVTWQEVAVETKSALNQVEDRSRVITGREAFILHDTYGFPIELTREVAAEHGMTLDEVEFAVEMDRQRVRARAAAGGGEALAAEAFYGSATSGETVFRGYEGLEFKSHPMVLFADGDRPSQVAAPGEVEIMLAETPFYPEGGGQVGDRGDIVGPSGRVVVEDTQRVAERLIVHRGRVVEGRIAVGDEVTARVDSEHRADTMRNHTATHLLHAALRKVLGSHVRQAGSLVAPDHLRFDFTHTEAVTREQLAEVERLVNEKVRQNLPVHTRHTTFKEAMDEGVLAFFGDKYGEEVRVVEVNTVVPRFSAELCGGTHCERTGDVGLVIITGESSIGSGMRRIEALSGRGAEELVRQRLGEIEDALQRLGGARGALLPRIDALVAERDALAKRVERIERSLASAPAMDQIMDGAVDVDGVKVLASQVDLPSTDALRYRVDAVRKTMPSGIAVLGSVIDGRPQFVAIASSDVISKGLKAGDILKRVAAVAGGSAGGRPEMAQGGGKDPSKIQAALAVVPDVVREMLLGDGR